MSRSLYAKLHRRFGPKLSGAEISERAHAKHAEFARWLGLAAIPSDCARALPNGVAIVGGGFAGLAAAWTLGQVGVASTVFEARKTYGGRVESDRSLIPGRIIEAGAELIGLNHPMWIDLANRFGLGQTFLIGEDQYAGLGLEMPLRIGGKSVTDLEKLYKQMKFVLQNISNDAKAITDPFEPWKAPGAAAMDAKSVADKIAEVVRLLPKPIRHPLLLDAINLQLVNDHVLPTKEQSYLGLLALVSGGRLGPLDKNLSGYWEHNEDFRCSEGNDTLAGMMIEYGKRILFRPNSPVKMIEISETDSLVKVTWLDSTRGYQSKNFDYVVLTAPPSVWKNIIIKPALPPGQEMGLGPAVKYISQVNGRFWIKAGMAPNGLSDEFGQTWEATENQAASQGVALTVFAGGTFVPKSDAEKHFRTQLLKLYPGYKMKADRYANWPDEPWIETGYACPKVGQVTTIGKFLSVPHRQRLYFAGEHTCMAYFGYMEGALQSGARAAKAILASCLKKSSMGVGRERQVLAPLGESDEMRDGEFGKSLVYSTDQAIASGKLHCSAELLRHLLSEAHLLESRISTEFWDELPFSAADLFDAFASGGRSVLRDHFNRHFEVVALPGARISNELCPGDILERRALGEGRLAHLAVLVTGEIFRAEKLPAAGLWPESRRPGLFAQVVESGPFSHCLEDRFARRMGDEHGRLDYDSLILRIRHDAQDSLRPPLSVAGIDTDSTENTLAFPSGETTPGGGGSGGVDREPARPPFPKSFQDPIFWHEDVSLRRAFRYAISTVSDDAHKVAYDANGALPAASTIPIVIASLGPGGKPSFAGQNIFQIYYSGSLLKVAAMYAAFQLRKAVADFADTLPSGLTQDEVFKRFSKAFDAKILASAPTIPAGSRVAPKYADILKVTPDGAHYKVEFLTVPDPSRRNFDGHLHRMVEQSHNPSAGVCIQNLGYSWINGVLRAADMFKEDTSKPRTSLDRFAGIWLAGDYLYGKPYIDAEHQKFLRNAARNVGDPPVRFDAEAEEEFQLGISGLTPVRIPCVNEQAWHAGGGPGDGRSQQATSCLDMANLFVQVANGTLIKGAAAANTTIGDMLKTAVAMSIIGSLALSTHFKVLQSKIGLGTLGSSGSCYPDLVTGLTNGCVYSEAMVIQENAPPNRKYVVVYQDIRDPGNHNNKDLERVRDIIELTMGYSP